MKLDIKTMLITLGVCILFAFTATDIMTVKPAQPTVVFVTTYSRSTTTLVKTIDTYAKKGYIVKSCSSANEWGDGLLIMEKY